MGGIGGIPWRERASVRRASGTIANAARAATWLTPLALIAWVQWSVDLPDTRAAGDLDPVYWGAASWLRSGDAYDLGWITPPEYGWEASRLRIGNVYPLPASLLIGLPFQALEPLHAAMLFLLMCLTGMVVLLRASGLGPAMLWWLPVLEASRVYQVELLVVVGYLMLWLARRGGHVWWAGVAVLLLSLKPHSGAAGIILAIWWFRPRWWPVLLPTTCVWGISLALQPDWPARWLAQVALRNELIGIAGAPRYLALASVACLLLWQARRSDPERRDGFLLAGLALLMSVALPWPMPAWYPAAAWLIGLPRPMAAVAVLPPLALWLVFPAPVALAAGITLALASHIRDERRVTTHG